MSDIHIIKLAVDVENLQSFYDLQQSMVFDYHGIAATPCWTRYKPKRGDEIIKKGGSIYRVVKNRIVCRHKILGFEMVETHEKGKMCMIVQDAEMIETIAVPRRPFQGWRYLKGADAPNDKGIYTGERNDIIPDDLAEELQEAGIL